MTREYEFSYQTPKQKAILIVCKALVILLLTSALHTLGWSEWADLQDKIMAVGTVFGSCWMYANLTDVKVEVQEIFVPPMKMYRAKEFLFVAVSIAIGDTLWTIYQIYLLS